jgi:ABC-type sugar transport systems, permease components
MKHKTTRKDRQEFLWGWGFILPCITGLMILNIIPIFQTIYQSFFKSGPFGRGNIFIGTANYRRMLADPNILSATWNTFKYALLEVPASIFIALVLAVLLNQNIKGKTIFRAIFFIPMVAAPAAVAMVWKWLYNSRFGLINHILNSVGLHSVEWLTNPHLAIVSVAIIGIWSVIGYNMVLFIAGLQEIPKDFYEAAAIDGAGSVYQFFNITIPLISPTMFFVVVTRVIAGLQVFDTIFMLITEQNPAFQKTQSLVYLFYKYAFVENDKGYGSTIVVFLLLIIMIITVIQMIAQKKWVYYN